MRLAASTVRLKATQIGIVSGDASSCTASQPLLIGRCEIYFESGGNLDRDSVLHRKHTVEFAHIALTPQSTSATRLNQVDIDSEDLLEPLHRAGHKVVHTQLG